MKRLLAYLFLVLGLGLTFSVSANASLKQIYNLNVNYCKSSIINFKMTIGTVVATLESCDKFKGIGIGSYTKSNVFEYKKYNNEARKTWRGKIYNTKFCLRKDDSKRSKSLATKLMATRYSCKKLGNDFVKVKFDGNKFYTYEKTFVAKQEPSQTQKVAKKERHICVVSQVSSYLITEYQEGDFDQRCTEKFYKSKNPKLYNKFMQVMLESSASGLIPKNTIISLQTFNDLKGKTQIAKAEPTVKPKKKVKVAKVEDSTQEEFKPKKTNQDNEAPVITIAEAITVNDTDYEFQGKVTDQAKTIYVEVDGRPTDVKNGKFIVKGYSPIDKQISIEAIDQWGNRSEPKIVKLTIDIKDTSIAEKLEPLNPSKIRSKVSKDKVALIIGIENYLESPNAKYANLDAKYFFDYARKGFGVKKQNINLLVDEDATFVKTNKALTKWLRSKIKADQSDLIIFFAGHGLASSDGKELYLLPQDSDPDLLARTALSRTELFQEIINLNPKSVTMFLDTCYSGISRDEQMLLASARPIRIVADEQEGIPDNFTIFSASQLDQISSGIKEAKHGIFSYYLMKGLEGNADANKDKNITNGELLAYMDENVSQKAAEQGREQNPSLAGDPNKVLINY